MKTRVLVPSGIGDIYWVMVKLPGFLREHNISNPEIWVDAPNDKKRSKEFVERVPFVSFGGYHKSVNKIETGVPMAGWMKRKRKTDPVRYEAYHSDKRHAFKDFEGFDWFISFNGSIDTGRPLEDIEPQWGVQWDIDFKITKDEEEYGKKLRDRIVKKYIVSAFFDSALYSWGLSEMPADKIYGMLVDLSQRTDSMIVLTGASWDDSPVNRSLLELDANNGYLMSIIGQTTVEEYFGALRAAAGCIGFPAGNTMMGAVFGVPTAIIWNDHFNRQMHVNALPRVPNYIVANTKDDPMYISCKLSSLIGEKQKAE